jgi:hypothetical protein
MLSFLFLFGAHQRAGRMHHALATFKALLCHGCPRTTWYKLDPAWQLRVPVPAPVPVPVHCCLL